MGCITWVGTDHYYGRKPFGVGKRIRCVKERNNEFDSGAIRAAMKGIGMVAYVVDLSKFVER